MSRNKFEEGDVWAHRYGGLPHMNAHMLVKKIGDKLFLVNKYLQIDVTDTEPEHNILYWCGVYGDYYKKIMKKEGYDG